MKYHAVLTFIYGLIVLIGGLMGYVQAQSMASLAMGTLFAFALFSSSIIMLNGKRTGLILATIFAALLCAFFSYRFILTLKVMPAGVMIIFSLILLFFLIPDTILSRQKNN